MNINGRELGSDYPPYIVAEISCNHGGDIGRAKSLIDAAYMARADAVKFQTYEPNDLTTPDNVDAWKLYTRAMTPREWHKELFKYANDRGLTAFSSPFSVNAVEFLERECNPPCYKIASPEALRGDIIDAAARTGKPLIVSIGALTEGKIWKLYERFTHQICFLHCIAHYPARIEEANIRALNILQTLTYLVGISDHTPGYAVPVAAVCYGAMMVEKHIKLDDNCIDAEWSLDPQEFKEMANNVRAIWQGLGTGLIKPSCGSRAKVVEKWQKTAA